MYKSFSSFVLPSPPWKITFSAIVVTLANKKTMLHSLSVAHHINLFFCLLVWLWRQHVPQNRQKTQNTRPFYLKFHSCGLCLFDLLWPLWEFFGGEIKNSCSPQCIWIELTLSDFTGFQPWIYLEQGICQDKFSHVYLSQYHSTLNYAHPTRRSSQQVLPADLAESCFPASLTIFQLSHVLWPPPSTTFCVYQTTFVCLFLPE